MVQIIYLTIISFWQIVFLSIYIVFLHFQALPLMPVKQIFTASLGNRKKAIFKLTVTVSVDKITIYVDFDLKINIF